MRFISDSIYYAATLAGLWKTFNAGHTWNKLTHNFTYQKYRFFSLASTGGVAVIRDDRILWSNNGNDSFVDITPPDSLRDGVNTIFINPNNQLFTTTKKGLARSSDLGTTWQTVVDSIVALDMLVHPSGRLVAVIGTKVILSDDEGQSWQTVTPSGGNSLSALRIVPNGDLYIMGLNSQTSSGVLLKSEDAGATWTVVPNNIGNNQFWHTLFATAVNGHLFICNDDRLMLRSANEGLNWQTLPPFVDNSGPIGVTNLSISPSQHLYVGTTNGVFRSVEPVSAPGAYVSGHLRQDADADCSTPDAQTPLKNWAIKADGVFDSYTQTDPAGYYVFFLDTGAYQLSTRVPQQLWWSLCDSLQTVTLDTIGITDTLNFTALALADCPLLSVDIAVPQLRRCFNNNLYVYYCNQGTETADSAYVDILLDPYLSLTSANLPYTDLGNHTFRFQVGPVGSGNCGQFSLQAYVNCDSTVIGQTHCVTAHAWPDTFCTPVPAWSGANLEAEVVCQDSVVQLSLQNTGPAASQTLDFIIIEDDVVLMQGHENYAPGQVRSYNMPAGGHTWRIESEQEPGHPFSTVALAFAEGCGGFNSLGFINQFSVNGIKPSWDRACRENIGSYDPNDKQGFPTGYGEKHLVRPGQELEYLIRFQNTGTDTAFTVVIRDTLSPWLDPAALRPGAASHPYTWTLAGPGVVVFTFQNILLPDSNTNLAGSQGFIGFRVAQQPDVPLNTQIFNQAAIYFDFNTPVITNRTLHTVGVDYLTGTVAPPKSAAFSPVLVSPNPMTERAVFRLREGAFRQHRLTVTDALGATIRQVNLSGSAFTFLSKDLRDGLYFWKIEDATGRLVQTGRLVLLKNN